MVEEQKKKLQHRAGNPELYGFWEWAGKIEEKPEEKRRERLNESASQQTPEKKDSTPKKVEQVKRTVETPMGSYAE